ncbi:hypothetical protein [Acetobacterium wieringae]|uniref:5-bromo-4-chloroindolyl phosphate hydrolysis protein n=1 Tax=Acetobacterium wieringae TaxID=52694 RepID=A0A1F2PML6_9FIRM|nr:hypothetical protein [Acetobacterium wieringae]OFV72195.1 hypothetical protein ACWI_01010 [Acetobacterium wieringae]
MDTSTFFSNLFALENSPIALLSLFVGGAFLTILFVFVIYYVVFRVKHEPPEKIKRPTIESPSQDLVMFDAAENPNLSALQDRNIAEQARLQKLIGLLKTAKRRESLYSQEVILEDLEAVISKVRDKISKEPDLQVFPQYASHHAETAIQLLNTYLDLDRTPDDSMENINKIRNEIIASFPPLLEFYQDYLNRLYDAQYFDVASDVEVVKSISADKQDFLRK